MVNILVELNGFRQLSRLRESPLADTLDALKGIATYSGATCIHEERGVLLFELDARRSGPAAAGALIGALDDALRERRLLLGGYTIVAEDYDEVEVAGSSKELPALRRAALLADRNESILLGRRIRRKVRSRFLCDGNALLEFAPVTERRDADRGRVPKPSAFLTRPNVVRDLQTTLKRLFDKREIAWIDVWGASKTPNGSNVKAALAGASDAASSAPWLELHPGPAGPSVFDPFLGGVRREVLEVVPNYLSRTERLLWEQRRSIFAFICPDHAVEDFLAAYSLYLLAYARFMARHGIPPVIICEDIDRYSAETIEILARLLRRLSGHALLVAICLHEDEVSLAPLDSIAHERIRVAPFEAEEARLRLEQSDLSRVITVEDAMLQTDGRGHLLFHLLLLLALAAEEAGDEEAATREAETLSLRDLLKGHTVSQALLERLKASSRRILYAATLTRGVLDPAQLDAFFRTRGSTEQEWKGAVKELEQAGFIERSGLNVLMPEVAVTFAGEFLSEDLPGAIAAYAHGLWEKRAFHVRASEIAHPGRMTTLFAFLSRYGRFAQALDAFIEIMMQLLDEGNVAQAVHYLEHEDLFRMPIVTDEMRTRDYYLELFALRAATLLEERDQADVRLSRLKEMGGNDDVERSLLELACAQHLYATGEHRAALDSAKRSLLSAQASQSAAIEKKADIEIGLCMLASAKFEEAEEYFSIACGDIEEGTPSLDLIRGLCFEAVSLYLFGNVSKALRTIGRAREEAATACRREWQRYALFLEGRCLLTLGKYDAAARNFRVGASFCRIYPHEEASAVFESWRARAAAHREPQTALDTLTALPPRPESLYFSAEICVLLDDFARAAELLERSLELQQASASRYLPGEIIPWTSGFAGLEDRAILTPGGEGVLRNLTLALRAYAHGKRYSVAEGIAELTRMTRDDRLSSQDPYLYLYYYLQSLMVPAGEGDLLVNKLTALSKALKYVQERAARVDDVKLRLSYLRANVANAGLLDEAKRYKLM